MAVTEGKKSREKQNHFFDDSSLN